MAGEGQMILWNWLGTVPIREMFALQDRLFVQKTQGDERDYLLFVEHLPVYTKSNVGEIHKNGSLWRKTPPADIPAEKVRRGGSITFHGPGQIVCYCIFDLAKLGMGGVLGLNDVMDGVLEQCLAGYGIYGERRRFPIAAQGIWVAGEDGSYRKIASRGIFISRGLSKFGFALNVYTDLSFFDYIYPCGLDIQMSSMFLERGLVFPLLYVARDLAVQFQCLLGLLGVEVKRDCSLGL